MIDWEKRYFAMYDIGLIFNCPFELELGSCPFKSLREEKETNIRYNLWKKMNSIQKKEVLRLHRECMKRRSFNK